MSKRQISIPSRLDQIEAVLKLVEIGAHEVGFDERTNYSCQLAVGEACENIIKHGYGAPGEGFIEVNIHSHPRGLLIELHDSAPPFDAAMKPNSHSWQLEDPPVGGLGLLIIHKVMDEVEYCRNGNQNYLKLQKYTQKASP